MSKYHNQKTNGYASKKESRRAQELWLLQSIKAISDLKEQVKFELTPKIGKERASHYIADFTFTEDGKSIVEDCKGKRTAAYILKRKIMLYRYGIEIRET